jgi:RNA 2',3'-cyclic 3'-phosphodiesterase
MSNIPNEQEEAYRRVWQNLRQVTHVTDGRHDTAEWRAHRGDFALCCVRIPASAISPLIEDVRDVLRRYPFVRLHPDHFLHIPVQELGFLTDRPQGREDLTPARLREIIAQAEVPISDFAPFPITLGGVNSFVDAAFLDVHDNGWLGRIHRRLLDFVAIPPDQRFSYLPQVTIAHYTGRAPIDNLPAALAPWRDQPFGGFRVTSIDIVRIRTDEPYPDLVIEHQFMLGQHQPLLEVVHGGSSRNAAHG